VGPSQPLLLSHCRPQTANIEPGKHFARLDPVPFLHEDLGDGLVVFEGELNLTDVDVSEEQQFLRLGGWWVSHHAPPTTKSASTIKNRRFISAHLEMPPISAQRTRRNNHEKHE